MALPFCKLVVALGIILLITETQGSLCPDKKIRCGTGQTCCSNQKGSYACCPYEGATCCSDGTHCCPHGTQCDIAHGRCVQGKGQLWALLQLSEKDTTNGDSNDNAYFVNDLGLGGGASEFSGNETSIELKKQKCADGERICPDNYTCCPLTSGGFGCCPYKGAMCCADQVHCCPAGQKCDAQTNSCV